MAVNFFIAEFGVAMLQGVKPIKEIGSLNSIELNQVSVKVLANHCAPDSAGVKGTEGGFNIGP